MAICPHCRGYLRSGHVCRQRPDADSRLGDFFVGIVLGGAVGVLLFGMMADALFGRALDTPGLLLGSLAGFTFVRTSRRLQLH